MNQFKFGDMVKSRMRKDKQKGVVVAKGANQYSVIVRWEHESGGVSQEHVESLELIPHANQNRWIGVNDSLPPENETVLLLDHRNNMRSGYLDGDAIVFIYTDSDDWLDDEMITHWQPIPALPENQNKG